MNCAYYVVINHQANVRVNFGPSFILRPTTLPASVNAVSELQPMSYEDRKVDTRVDRLIGVESCCHALIYSRLYYIVRTTSHIVFVVHTHTFRMQKL